jgi:diketogulonate reductase-like aldo/keto reductase
MISSYLLVSLTGVSRASGGELVQAVKAALAAGYRHIDDAWRYGVCTPMLLRGIYQSKHPNAE